MIRSISWLFRFHAASRRKYFDGVGLTALAAMVAPILPEPARAGGVQTLSTVEVIDATTDLVGVADTATEGTVLKEQLDSRPVYRVGELLENTPGLIVTQHSGEGKANQYYLRGFNLDHGTDMAITVDDMPVNMRTHAHGQGYSDLNFMIPELASGMKYRKGPYYADEGDFATAGAVHIGYTNKLDKDMVELSGGSFGYGRGVTAMSRPVSAGNVIMAVEGMHLDGPWVHPDDYNKGNAVLRYVEGDESNGYSVTGMAYAGRWNATNQEPMRAIDSGLISRFGTLDPTDGGDAKRYSLSTRYAHTDSSGSVKASAYVIGDQLDLYNNFTFYLNDPVNGDQFHQHETRLLLGGKAAYSIPGRIAGLDTENTIGTELRNDDVQLGLFHSRQRNDIGTTRTDSVTERSGAVFVENRMQWLEKLRTVAGLRGDVFTADVSSNNHVNSGDVTNTLLSPKGNLILGPWAATEFYLSWGRGYHSNDARSATTTISPTDGSSLTTFPLLQKALGEEVGVRTSIIPHLQSSLALFRLRLSSEQVFSGDAGDTSPSGKSTRQGIEFANFYTPFPGVILDADLAVTQARFHGDISDGITSGKYIAGSPRTVIGAGISLDDFGPWFGGLQFRYFGERPLTNDNSVRSGDAALFNARVGYKVSEAVAVKLDVDNLFNQKVQDVAYYYQSQLKGEASPVNDVHMHPAEPLGVRLALVIRW